MNDAQAEQVECPATKDTAVRLFIVAAMALGAGIYCLYDAIVDKYPYKPFDENINDWANWAFNHYGPYVFIPVGLIFAAFAVRSLTRRLTADQEGIGYAGKDKIAWKDITALDASLLESKQILRLRHGQDKLLTLDAYKLKNFRDMVAFIEARVPEGAKPQAADAAPREQDR